MKKRSKKKLRTWVKVVLFLIIAGAFLTFCYMRYFKEEPATKPVDNPSVEEPSKPSKEPKDPIVEALEKEKYYIPDRLERYKAYKQKNQSKTYKEIVTEVNCDIDRPFYTDIQKADVSKGYLILVNKYYAVDKEYKPASLTPLSTKYTYWGNSYLSSYAYDSYIQMIEDGRSLGYKLMDTSNLRTYSDQEHNFNRSINQNGLEWALKASAKPGHSEHETGLASDIVKQGVSMYDFGSTKEYTWLKENAHKYGFILRYPEGKEYLTGYMYEPWHYRYVGKEAAKYIYENDIVFEEYYAYFCLYKKSC